jgi:transcriptional regulator with XRE-family HTH domain
MDPSDQAKTEFGQRVRALRRQKGLSIEALATEAELNDKFLGSVERGQQAATIETIAKIAGALGVDLHELFVRQDQSVEELRTRASALLAEAEDEQLLRVVAVLEAMLH